MYQFLWNTHAQRWAEYVCECSVTERLNYGLIVSLAGFCCCHHIGPVKVNYWNMFICCQPLLQAVTCMETQTNTHRHCSLNSRGTLCPLSHQHVPQPLNFSFSVSWSLDTNLLRSCDAILIPLPRCLLTMVLSLSNQELFMGPKSF